MAINGEMEGTSDVRSTGYGGPIRTNHNSRLETMIKCARVSRRMGPVSIDLRIGPFGFLVCVDLVPRIRSTLGSAFRTQDLHKVVLDLFRYR